MSDVSKESRTYEMCLVGYYLSRCSKKNGLKPSTPPEKLRVSKWTEAFDLFFEKLGGTRNQKTFRNSMKNVVSSYDRIFPENKRVGWKDRYGVQRPLSEKDNSLHQQWKYRSNEELEERIFRLIS